MIEAAFTLVSQNLSQSKEARHDNQHNFYFHDIFIDLDMVLDGKFIQVCLNMITDCFDYFT
jgi:hypothetical protein